MKLAQEQIFDEILKSLNIHHDNATEKIEISPADIYQKLNHLFDSC